MKLLIVEDNTKLAEITAQLLDACDQSSHHLEAITLAADLRTAILRLPEHDAVLCDGRFPVSPGSRLVVKDWDVICREAHRRGLHFVLYSGSPHALESARENHILALTKPAAIEEIYAALTHPRPNFANARHFSQEKCMLCQQPTDLGQNLLDSSLSGNVGSLSNERINYHAARERPGKCPCGRTTTQGRKDGECAPLDRKMPGPELNGAASTSGVGALDAEGHRPLTGILRGYQ